LKHRTCVLVIAALAFLSALTANAQSPDMVADLAVRINRERTSRGLVPYALNSDLTIAAQAHASDMARTGNLSHTGSDGSTVFQRVARTGYGSYSWGRRLGENWAWYHSTADAMAKWMNSRPHRENILHALYREFGIGIAANPVGGYIFVVDFGAQPNVLPVFINDGAGATPTPGVTVVLSDEEVAPAGDTPTTIGHPTEIQISNDQGFPGATWEPYSTRRSWTLASGRGVRTVYVKFRDALGRTVTSSDSIAVGDATGANVVSALPTVKPTASRTSTRRPTVTRTRTPRPTSRPSATAGRTGVPTQTEAVATPSETLAGTFTPDAGTGEPVVLAIGTPSVEATEVAAMVVTPAASELPPDQVEDNAIAPWQQMIDSLAELAARIMSNTVKVGLAVFAMAAVIGIMAATGFRSGRIRAAEMQMRTKRPKRHR
jgi:hypothetical protein